MLVFWESGGPECEASGEVPGGQNSHLHRFLSILQACKKKSLFKFDHFPLKFPIEPVHFGFGRPGACWEPGYGLELINGRKTQHFYRGLVRNVVKLMFISP